MKAHPLAEAYRLMTQEELASLADSLLKNGQLDPIYIADLDGEEVIVDGRNRLLACEIAGIKPRFEKVNGKTDLREFVLAKNNERRNISKGQQAMALAFHYPEPDKGGRGKKSESKTVAKRHGFSNDRLSDARAVLAYSRELAEGVRDGTTSLDEALAKMRSEQEAKTSKDAKLARLQHEAPDLANLVARNEITLGQAMAAFAELQREQESIRTEGRAARQDLEGLEANIVSIGNAIQLGEQLLDDEILDAVSEAIKLLRDLFKRQEKLLKEGADQ